MTKKKKTDHDDSADLRKGAEEALRKNEILYRELFEAESDAIVLIDNATGNILEANSATVALYGYDHAELLTKRNTDLSAEPEETQRVTHGTPIISDQVVNIPLRFHRKKDGTVFPTEITGRFFIREGRPVHIVAIRDITERKQAEEALRESEGLLRGLFENMTSGAAIYEVINDGSKGSDYIIRDFNVTSLRIEGKRKDEVIGKSLFDLRPNIDQYGLIPIFQKVWRTGEPGYFPSTIYIDEKYSHWYENRVFKLPTGEIVAIYDDVTERKRAEEALAKSEALLREAQGAAHIGHWELDTSIMTPAWSEEIFHIFGLDPEEDEPSFEAHQKVTHPDDWDILNNAVTTSIVEGIPFDIEFRILRPDKTIRWMHAIGYPKKDSKGRTVSVFGTAQDITDRKSMEDTLRVSLEKYRVVFESFPLGITISDKLGKIIEGNRQSEQLLGINREAHAQRRIDSKEWQIIRKDGTPMPADEFASTRALRENRLIENVEMGIVKDKGEITWISVTAAPIPLEGYGVAIAYGDITERRRAEKEIQSLARFPSENPGPILRIARDGTLLYINQAGLNLLPEWHLQVGKATPLTLREAVLQVLDNGSTRRLDLEHLRQIYSFSVVPVVGAGYANLYARDVTERRKAEEALRKSESQLRALSLELSLVEERERKRLALYLHDEIGQSLALLRMKFGSLAGIWGSKFAKQNIQQIRGLLEKVIDQTHTLTFELSPPVLHQLGLEAAIEWAGEKISQDFGIEFMFSDDGMIKPLSADIKALLFRCVRELMMNIAKHAKARKITVSLKRTQNQFTAVVEDNGIGFEAPLSERQPEKVRFGLLSVREHLSAVGGSYEFQSEPGRGTRITLSVPLKEEMPSS